MLSNKWQVKKFQSCKYGLYVIILLLSRTETISIKADSNTFLLLHNISDQNPGVFPLTDIYKQLLQIKTNKTNIITKFDELNIKPSIKKELKTLENRLQNN